MTEKVFADFINPECIKPDAVSDLFMKSTPKSEEEVLKDISSLAESIGVAIGDKQLSRIVYEISYKIIVAVKNIQIRSNHYNPLDDSAYNFAMRLITSHLINFERNRSKEHLNLLVMLLVGSSRVKLASEKLLEELHIVCDMYDEEFSWCALANMEYNRANFDMANLLYEKAWNKNLYSERFNHTDWVRYINALIYTGNIKRAEEILIILTVQILRYSTITVEITNSNKIYSILEEFGKSLDDLDTWLNWSVRELLEMRQVDSMDVINFRKGINLLRRQINKYGKPELRSVFDECYSKLIWGAHFRQSVEK